MPEPVPGIGFAPCDRRNKPIWQDENIRLIPVIPAELPLVSSFLLIFAIMGLLVAVIFSVPQVGRKRAAESSPASAIFPVASHSGTAGGSLWAAYRRPKTAPARTNAGVAGRKAVPGLPTNWP